mmetsp:Transcript_26069/g.60387  ORF Transcript_26069/g.60387 Transcript_26069/m.60387 type:complete len:331 (-) Transcript_26069:1329-2321(-)
MGAPALQRACEANGMAYAQGVNSSLIVRQKVAVPDNHELRVSSSPEDVRDRFDEEIAALLCRVPPHEEEHGVHASEALVGFGVANPLILPLHVRNGGRVDAVVDDGHPVPICTANAAHLVFEHPGHTNELVRSPTGTAFEVFDAWMSFAHVPISSPFCGVHREHHSLALSLKLHDTRSSHPVVSVDDVESTPHRLVAIQGVDKGPTHVPGVLYEAARLVVAHLMVVHAQDLVVFWVALRASEDVNLVPGAIQSPSELRHVWGHAAHRNGVKCLPRQHRDLQRLSGHGTVLGRLHGGQQGFVAPSHAASREALQEPLHSPLFVTLLEQPFP